ncbi:MAG TPA: hypothetical protein PLQ03_04205 [Brevundimonas sp.]|uniref:hypothetical protein n=1 Tax=Brevundimonas sp. TaxID=1871086 RepID=UPI0026260090|nr:hypothetical protein [Brevundimonas sp.]HRO32595.1 hypothetical protein [Brevundimonas sp.]
MTTFHHIRLELAREPGSPSGDPDTGYDIVAPLNDAGKLDGEALKAEPQRGRVRAFTQDRTTAAGRLTRGPGGRWLLDFEPGVAEDATGFHFGDERFVPGEYVSLTLADGRQHTYVVARVQPV